MNLKIILHILPILILCTNYTFAQTSSCDTIYSIDLDKQPTYGNNDVDVLRLFNDELIGIITDNYEDDYPPTSFRMVLIINSQDEVESISKIQGNYSEKAKETILEKLKNLGGWKSGERDGQKVCAEYYFVVGCILWK